MSSLEEIRKQLSSLDDTSKRLVSEELPKALMKDERVEQIIQGSIAQAKTTEGIIVATGNRLILVSKIASELNIEDFPYSAINSIQYKTGLQGEITLLTSGKEVKIVCDVKRVGDFAGYVHAQLADVPSPASLRKCPKCAELIQNEAIFCKHCRSDISPFVSSEKISPETPNVSTLINEKTGQLCCTKCSSVNIQKLSLVHSGGIVDVNLRTSGSTAGIGVGVGAGGIGVGVGAGKNSSKTSGTQQSQLSVQAAPPAPPPMYIEPDPLKATLITGLFSFMLLVLIAAYGNQNIGLPIPVNFNLIGGLIASIFVYIKFKKSLLVPDEEVLAARRRYRVAREAWEREFLCLTCGNVFEVDSSDDASIHNPWLDRANAQAELSKNGGAVYDDKTDDAIIKIRHANDSRVAISQSKLEHPEKEVKWTPSSRQ